MMEYALEAFAGQLISLSIGGEVLTDAMLEYTGRIVERAAKDKIGEYQPEAGIFSAWAELKESTKQDRVAQGFSRNEPLLRTGEMRDSIGYRVGFQEVNIGSDDPIAEYQELGTDKIPARSFLGGAAFEEAPKIVEHLGIELNSFLVGQNVIGKLKIT